MSKPASHAGRIQFRSTENGLSVQLGARSDDHKGQGSTAARDLQRYYAMLERELRGVTFTDPEALCLLDITNGTLLQPESWTGQLAAEVQDALEDPYAEKWGVDGPALLEKVRSLGYAQMLAVVDALERWRLLPNEQRGPAELRRLGLVRP